MWILENLGHVLGGRYPASDVQMLGLYSDNIQAVGDGSGQTRSTCLGGPAQTTQKVRCRPSC